VSKHREQTHHFKHFHSPAAKSERARARARVRHQEIQALIQQIENRACRAEHFKTLLVDVRRFPCQALTSLKAAWSPQWTEEAERTEQVRQSIIAGLEREGIDPGDERTFESLPVEGEPSLDEIPRWNEGSPGYTESRAGSSDLKSMLNHSGLSEWDTMLRQQGLDGYRRTVAWCHALEGTLQRIAQDRGDQDRADREAISARETEIEELRQQ
jgi:hypothetical protein